MRDEKVKRKKAKKIILLGFNAEEYGFGLLAMGNRKHNQRNLCQSVANKLNLRVLRALRGFVLFVDWDFNAEAQRKG